MYSTHFDVDPTLSSDLFLLAKAVLSGDQTAALLLADCVAESWNSGGRQRITPEYVDRLEDLLMSVKATLHSTALTYEGDISTTYGDCYIEKSEATIFHHNLFQMEQQARSLNRQGLS